MTYAPTMIDDLSLPHPVTPLGTRWELMSDQVMGGVSEGRMTRETVAGREALRLKGGVRLDNDGGFLQLALDLAVDGGHMDASVWRGIALTVRGLGETYNLHLRTADIERPWQSYRAHFEAQPEWHEVIIPFASLEVHRVEATFDPATLRRIGLVAIGRAFEADLAVSQVRFVA